MAVIVKWNAAVEAKRDGGLTSRNEYAKLFCDSWKLLHVNARKRKSRLETGSREPSAGVRRTRGTAELASEQPAQEGKNPLCKQCRHTAVTGKEECASGREIEWYRAADLFLRLYS